MVNERDIGKTVIILDPKGWGKLYKIEAESAFIEMPGGYLLCCPLNVIELPTIIGKEVKKDDR